ncbi:MULTISPECIES: DinB family protein [Aeromicrobium]|uniref:DUF664 domain-containing protein n=1 Tax=Aeromicrobium yanjiei TaxID=2662028 RepID=A0A5Q2MM26_9ACTN|nr:MULTISPECIES: DinB family protein [Aeromicrobium]MRK01033.1 DUF664 domain-containing protein [Aeromicrobium sp. S22]QGG42162.1 DUF664 domain-containing protein [Aeromicrobium yanjiei]
MTWTAPAPPALTDGPTTGDDRPMLEAMLEWHRWTLPNICAGLSDEQLATRPIASSNLSLLGLLRHMAKVERIWFRKRVAQQDVEHLHDFDARNDTDFNVIDASDAERAYDELVQEQRAAASSVADLPFDLEIETHHGAMSLRMVHLHMIQEYARHNGHADLLREAIDGTTGR